MRFGDVALQWLQFAGALYAGGYALRLEPKLVGALTIQLVDNLQLLLQTRQRKVVVRHFCRDHDARRLMFRFRRAQLAQRRLERLAIAAEEVDLPAAAE